MSLSNKPLVVSAGEPAGIGPDIAIMAWHKARDTDDIPAFCLIGDADHLASRADMLGSGIDVTRIKDPEEMAEACKGESFAKSLPVMATKNALTAAPGTPLTTDSKGVIESISSGIRLIEDGFAAGLVTLPINKKSLYDAGFNHPGHTEYLGALADELHENDAPHLPVMMLAGPKLKTVPVTIHIPLKSVPDELTSELIAKTGRIVAHDLQSRFGLENPRLAFAGLNPHAGEGGALGSEDEAIIVPAISALQAEGIDCVGPLPADTMFHDAARTRYDVAVCMYHDQALIPAKTLGFDDGVNVTLGLPFIRTSPDHGTAFDIAGTGKANPASFIAALKMARQMADLSK